MQHVPRLGEWGYMYTPPLKGCLANGSLSRVDGGPCLRNNRTREERGDEGYYFTALERLRSCTPNSTLASDVTKLCHGFRVGNTRGIPNESKTKVPARSATHMLVRKALKALGSGFELRIQLWPKNSEKIYRIEIKQNKNRGNMTRKISASDFVTVWRRWLTCSS